MLGFGVGNGCAGGAGVIGIRGGVAGDREIEGEGEGEVGRLVKVWRNF